MRTDTSWRALLRPAATSAYAFGELPPLPRPGPTFSPSLAAAAAEVSRLAYQPREGVRRRALAKGPFEEVAMIETGSTCCLVVICHKGPFAVAAFRGTDEPADWRLNVDAICCDGANGGKVHRGFARAFGSIAPDLERVLFSLPRATLLCGHSQGGALAVLAAARFDSLAVYTFGAPRVGDAAFVASVESIPHFRVVNAFDPVPELPPAGPPQHMTHGGSLVWLDEAGEFGRATPTITQRVLGFAGSIVDPEAWRLRRAEAPHWLADHAPINYAAKLLRHASRGA